MSDEFNPNYMWTMKNTIIFCILLLFIIAPISFAEEAVQVSITDFGVEPGSHQNTTLASQAAVQACREKLESGADAVKLVFPKGEYHFFNPEGRDRTFGISLDGLKNVSIEGNGSEFIFHGTMGICSINNCENVVAQNFSVDWEKPYIVQGNILESTDEYVDVKFDTNEYQYEITEGNLLFIGENWKRKIDGYTLLFDKDTKEIVYRTRDGAIGHSDFFNKNPEDRGNGIIRFHGRPNHKAEPGTYVALWLGRYVLVGFDLKQSKDITLENIDVFHALSHGVVAFKTENITLRKVDYKTNAKKDRVFSLVADGYHLNTCKGLVTIENCTQEGMGDDFLNLHGMNVMIENRVDDNTVSVKTRDRGSASYVLGVGDEVWFIDATTMQRGQTNKIKEIKDVMDGRALKARHVVFENKIPETIKPRDAIENRTWNAELEMRDCKILKRHRARGILVTTPKRAVIENNYFRTAGTAILIEGDVDYWYESGASNDLLIRGNVFEDCFSSGFAGDWGHAVITIHPSHKPQNDDAAPYHRNIRIENNVFKSFDYPILFARSVGGLRFTNNNIERTKTHEPFAANKATFWLDGCRDVIIEKNSYGNDVLGKNIKTLHMKPTDTQLNDKEITDLNDSGL